MKWRNGHTFGVQRQPVDLLAHVEEFGMRNPHNPVIEVMLQYYIQHPCCNELKFDYTSSIWIDVEHDFYISTSTHTR